MRSEKLAFSKAWKEFPVCCHGAWDEQRTTIRALLDAAHHELDMFEEQQDGCILDAEAPIVQQFITKWQNQQ